MQLSRTQHDPHARLTHKMNGHIFHVDGCLGHQAIEGIAIVHVTPQESGGYRLTLRVRKEVDSIFGVYNPESGYEYVLSEISGRVTELHSIDNDACGISFWTDTIRIITGENVHESMCSMNNRPSIVTFFLEMDNAMKDCLTLILILKGQISAYDGNPDFQWLQDYRIELLGRFISQYHSLRAEQETKFLEGCGNGQGPQDEDDIFF